MLFAYDQFPALTDGTITRTYRAWKRPQVKIGGRYRLHNDGVLEVDALSLVSVAQITRADARHAGFETKEALVDKLNGRGTLIARTNVYRVDFHYVAFADQRDAIAASAALVNEDAEALTKRLQKMDRLSKHGPWTAETLAIINRHPRVVASKLAEKLGRDRDPFKVDVRKLKKLGLTIRREVGYEISPRGRAYLADVRKSAS